MPSIEREVSHLFSILHETPLGRLAADLEEELLAEDAHAERIGAAQLSWVGERLRERLQLELAAQEELRVLEEEMDLQDGVAIVAPDGESTTSLAAPERSDAIRIFLKILGRWIEDAQGRIQGDPQ